MKTGILASALAVSLLSSIAAAAEKPWTEEELTSGVRKQESVRYAFAGMELNLLFLAALKIDCSEDEGWAYEITKPPEHGVADIIPYSDFTYFPKDNPRYKCNEHKVNAQMLTYRADDGYKGPDSFTVLSISPSGLAFERTYHFNVRNLPKKIKGAELR